MCDACDARDALTEHHWSNMSQVAQGGWKKKKRRKEIGAFLREVTMDTILLFGGWQLALDL